MKTLISVKLSYYKSIHPLYLLEPQLDHYFIWKTMEMNLAVCILPSVTLKYKTVAILNTTLIFIETANSHINF